MMTIYAVFMCYTVGGNPVCRVNAPNEEPHETLAECEREKRTYQDINGIRFVCMKEQIPAWEAAD